MNPVLNIIHFKPDDNADKIFLDEMNRRKQSFMEQMAEQKAAYKVWYGFSDKLPFRAISKSHREIVRYARDKGLPFIAIAEDDCFFTASYSLEHFFENMPEDADIYLGGISGGNVDMTCKDEAKPVEQWSGLFLYVIHQRFYNVFLSADPMNNIDRWLSGIGLDKITSMLGRKPVYKVCYPIVAISSDGISFNSRDENGNPKLVIHEKYFLPYEKLT